MGAFYTAQKQESERKLALSLARRRLYDAAKHATMEWRLHGQLTDSCRKLESALIEIAEQESYDEL
jgi:hypothetical protein